MKQRFIHLLIILLAMSVASCSQEITMPAEGVELTIGLTVASDVQTRTARPLESADNWQHVTDVRVYFFRADKEDGEFTLYHPQIEKTDGSTEKVDYIDVSAFNKTEIYKATPFESHYLTIRPKLPAGFYRCLAIGVDEEVALYHQINFTEGETTWENVVMALSTAGGSPGSETTGSETSGFATSRISGVETSELFSGYSDTLEVTSEAKRVSFNIELKRCVAGVLLYVKNIPDKYNGQEITSIKLILSGYSTSTDIVKRSWADDNPIQSEITLADFSALSAKEETVSSGNSSATTEETAESNKTFYKGWFLLPSRTSQLSQPVMRLDFCSDSKVVKSLDVVMVSSSDDDYQDPDDRYNLELSKDGRRYHLLANHLYCIGLRYENGEKDPIDLTKELKDDDNTVRIYAYGSWQADVDIKI